MVVDLATKGHHLDPVRDWLGLRYPEELQPGREYTPGSHDVAARMGFVRVHSLSDLVRHDNKRVLEMVRMEGRYE